MAGGDKFCMAQISQRVKKKKIENPKNYKCCKKTGEYCKEMCSTAWMQGGETSVLKSLYTTWIDKRYNYRPQCTT